METVNIYEAKTELSRLVARAQAGETIMFARRWCRLPCWGRLFRHKIPSFSMTSQATWLSAKISMSGPMRTNECGSANESFA
ncbi:MAG: hypothetical protein SPK50_01500 [Mobiluncus porci]|uniref:type II toxin-antitoxin system Phd/YefM family antitoxin n=1 Tax=Mobiluncus sp. TaxID=47293 RepID=UPI00258F9397|nr:hypothetical protein [Mobiluncus sp.]MCI6585477.1 hypothetical protein [Mobiluncus sp.]MDD7541314.1 hypothetical protein [Mobiluncus porci]MDY5747797.1 hypothetical protein [Mobiluncus porci]